MTIAKFTVGCSNCGVVDPVEGFVHRKNLRHRKWCVPCKREYQNNIYANKSPGRKTADAIKAASTKRLRRYGISDEQYYARIESMGGACPLCRTIVESSGRRSAWVIDHDHGCCPGTMTCGKCIRGIICHSCNQALGLAGDSVETLLAMVKYLAKEDPLS